MRTIAFLSFSVLAVADPPTIKVTTPPEITRLDQCIQTRFLASNVFGLNRIGPRPGGPIEVTSHRMRVFTPENPIEQGVVDQLREKRYEVAVYLVGRGALEVLPVPTPRGALQGPASVTLLADTRLPDADAIFSEGKTALATVGRGLGSDMRIGEWMVAMRPLRASNSACIQCHATVGAMPKLGDALGIVMYLYRGESPGPRQGL